MEPTRLARHAMNKKRGIPRVLDDAGELRDLGFGRSAARHRNIDVAQASLFDDRLFERSPFVGATQIDDGGEAKRLEPLGRAILENARGRDMRLYARVVDGERSGSVAEWRLPPCRLREDRRRTGERADCRSRHECCGNGETNKRLTSNHDGL